MIINIIRVVFFLTVILNVFFVGFRFYQYRRSLEALKAENEALKKRVDELKDELEWSNALLLADRRIAVELNSEWPDVLETKMTKHSD